MIPLNGYDMIPLNCYVITPLNGQDSIDIYTFKIK